MIKTIKISGVTKADLTTSNNRERYAWVKNNTGGNVYASVLDSTCTAEADNVAEIAAGDVRMVDTLSLGYLWLSGNGAVEIQLSDNVNCPFKLSQKGGDVSAEGDSVQLGGLQDGVPFSEVTVKGKNLIDYPYFYSSRTINGVTFTDNGDGTITADGTSTAQVWYFLRDKSENTMMNMVDGIYTLSGCPDGGSDSTYKLSMVGFNETDGISWDYDFGNGTTVECNTNQCDKFNCYIYIESGVTVDSLVFRPMLELGDTATEYAPTITGQELTVTACGKNILRYPYTMTTGNIYGITYTDNGDGTITASGTHDGGSILSYFGFSPWWASSTYNRLFIRKGETITYAVYGIPDAYQSLLSVKEQNSGGDAIAAYYGIGGAPITYTADRDCYIACGIQGRGVSTGATVDFTFYPQLEIGSTATAYEPYSGADYAITPDSNPYTVPTEIYQQDGINTVYVTGEGEPTLSVKGVKTNAAVKRIWDKLNELTTAIIVSNGEI